MLSREIEVDSYTELFKDDTLCAKSIKGVTDLLKRRFGDCIAPD
jgi:hypothetical protein